MYPKLKDDKEIHSLKQLQISEYIRFKFAIGLGEKICTALIEKCLIKYKKRHIFISENEECNMLLLLQASLVYCDILQLYNHPNDLLNDYYKTKMFRRYKKFTYEYLIKRLSCSKPKEHEFHKYYKYIYNMLRAPRLSRREMNYYATYKKFDRKFNLLPISDILLSNTEEINKIVDRCICDNSFLIAAYEKYSKTRLFDYKSFVKYVCEYEIDNFKDCNKIKLQRLRENFVHICINIKYLCTSLLNSTRLVYELDNHNI